MNLKDKMAESASIVSFILKKAQRFVDIVSAYK